MKISDITNSKDWVGLGIAGNQAEHLDQAGEAEDFKDVIALENAPKGMFPWFIPEHDSFLATTPLSSTELKLKGNDPLQPEPEIGLFVELRYAPNDSESLLENIKVIGFGAFNDCSRRIAADKISHKKNWGSASQGMSERIVPLDDFTTVGGTIEKFRLVCYLKRDEKLLQYGCDTAVSDYCYFNQQLIDWIVNQINTQQDQGPLEPIGEMISQVRPSYAVIGIGATCYTEFGNSEARFLQEGDEVFVAVYDATQHELVSVEQHIVEDDISSTSDSLIILRQKAVR